MEPLSALLALCAGNSPVPANSPHKSQWRGALMFSLICAWINEWVNNREAGDLRLHRGHYDVNVMVFPAVRADNVESVSMSYIKCTPKLFNTLRPRHNGRHFADAIFKWIFLNENIWIPIKISLKFVLQGPINNIPALVQIMAWRRPSDKPLSDPMMVRLPTHIRVTRPQWVKR